MSKIEWCDVTINPIVGCSKISEGCTGCYAEKMAYRLMRMGIPKYQGVVNKNGWTGKIGIDLGVFHKTPFKSKKIFVVSMGDLFNENVGIDEMDAVFRGMREYPWHTYILLTKRPQRMAIAVEGWFEGGNKKMPNVWLGVTAENQKRADERIPILLQIPAAVRFVSVEPMLEPVNLGWGENGHRGLKVLKIAEGAVFRCGLSKQVLAPIKDAGKWIRWDAAGEHYPEISWVICGPETGPKARPCKPEWIEDLYEQCKVAGVPFFDKRKNGWLAREYPKT